MSKAPGSEVEKDQRSNLRERWTPAGSRLNENGQYHRPPELVRQSPYHKGVGCQTACTRCHLFHKESKMQYPALGIDVSQLTLVVLLMLADGICQQGTFSNDSKGFAQLKRWLRRQV